jgi:CHAD domain-containing protein
VTGYESGAGESRRASSRKSAVNVEGPGNLHGMYAAPLPQASPITLRTAVPRIPHRIAPALSLDEGEPLSIGVQRTTVEQLDHALWVLRHELDRERAVHEARKALKRVRAVLRLVREPLGTYAYRQENTVVRDVSRRLSEVRTASVVVRTARSFVETHPNLLDPIAGRRLVVGLESRRDRLHTSRLHDRQALTDLVTTLLTVRSRYAAWPVTELQADPGDPRRRPFRDEFATVAPGLERTYRRGKEAMDAAVADRSTAAFHQWRKRVKYLRYQHEMLQPLWPGVMGAHAESLADLADGLGVEHDLAEMGAIIAGTPSLVLDPVTRYRLLSAIERERRTAQTDLVALGARLYAESPGAFIRRIGSYWAFTRR